MLILSRKVDEKLVIGDDVIVTISKIQGNRVVVAIDAPKRVQIRRGELPIRKSSPDPSNQDSRNGSSSASSVNVAAYHA